MNADEHQAGAPVDKFPDVDYACYREIFAKRRGSRPLTAGPAPHRQVDQHAGVEMWDALYERCLSLPDVTEQPSLVVDGPGSKALWLDESVANGPQDAFIAGREFAHMHTRPDASMHLQLPTALAALVVDGGWGELLAIVWLGFARPEAVMVYAPRDAEELDIVWSLVMESYRFARNEPSLIVFEPQPSEKTDKLRDA